MRALCVVSVVMSASGAQAGWRYTRWGMSPDEVTRASRGKAQQIAQPFERGSSRALLHAPYRMGRFTFDATFDFEDGQRLARVYLDAARPRSCPAIMARVTKAHGAGRMAPGASVFGDKRANNMISLLSYDDHCSVIFQPLNDIPVTR